MVSTSSRILPCLTSCLLLAWCSCSNNEPVGANGSGGSRGDAGTVVLLPDAAGRRDTAGTGGTVGTGGSFGTGGITQTGGVSGSGGASIARGTGGTTAPCNTLVNSAPVVVSARVAQDPPTPTGGTLIEGTYFLTSCIDYSGPGGWTVQPGFTIQATYVLTSSSTPGAFDLQLVSKAVAATSGFDDRYTLHIVPSGTSFRLDKVCPTQESGETVRYSVTDSGFMIFTAMLGVETFERQP
jgi:hypothetical protein